MGDFGSAVARMQTTDSFSDTIPVPAPDHRQHDALPQRFVAGEPQRPVLQRSTTLPVAPEEALLEEEGAEGLPEPIREAQHGRGVALSLAQHASKRLLQLMHDARDHLRFWEERLQAPSGHTRLLVLQTGYPNFFRHSCRWVLQFLGYPTAPPVNARLAIQHRVTALRSMNENLATALGEIHIQANAITCLKVDRSALAAIASSASRMERALTSLKDLKVTEDPDCQDVQDNSLLMVPRTPDMKPTGSGLSLPCVDEHLAQSSTAVELWKRIQKLQAATDAANVQLREVLGKYRSPSRAEQTWILRAVRNINLSGLALYLLAHSRLNGSADLEGWCRSVYQSVGAFFWEHLLQPVQQIHSELRRTFAANDEVDVMALRESRNILERMLQDFDQRQSGGRPLPRGGIGTMERVLARFEAEAKSPLTNLVTGDLSNLMMIQMQSIKIQMESGLLQMDRILQANQITFAAMTTLPVFGFIYGSVALIRNVARLHPLGNSRQSQAALLRHKRYSRILLVEAERAILNCQGREGVRPLEMGKQIFCLNALYVAARQQRHVMSGLEWHNLRTDILELAVPTTEVDRKLRILSRMSRSYSLFIE